MTGPPFSVAAGVAARHAHLPAGEGRRVGPVGHASLVGTFINLSPVIGVVAGVVVLDESVTVPTIVGGILVLAGVWISSARAAASG